MVQKYWQYLEIPVLECLCLRMKLSLYSLQFICICWITSTYGCKIQALIFPVLLGSQTLLLQNLERIKIQNSKHLERNYCVSPVNASSFCCSSLLFLMLLGLTDLLLTCKRLIPSLKKQKSACYNLWLSSLIIWIHNGFWPRSIVKALNGVTISALNKYEMVTCWHTAGT